MIRKNTFGLGFFCFCLFVCLLLVNFTKSDFVISGLSVGEGRRKKGVDASGKI